MLDKSDWYFIITIIMFFYLIYIYKRENFQSTTTGYLADIEAIRNLSNIATQLTTNNTLIMPGALNVTNKLLIGKSADGISSSISDSTYDTNSLSIVGQGTAPNRKVTLWDNVQINGNLSIPGKNVIDLGAGDTNRQVDSGKIGYNIWEDALNIVGKGNPSEARRISLYDNVKINGNLNINGSVTNNNKGFMYLIMKVGYNKQFVILDQNNNPLSFNDWVVHINVESSFSQKGGGFILPTQTHIFVGTDNNWQISINDYDDCLYLLCIPKNWFSYVSKPSILNNLMPWANGRIFYKSDGTSTSYKSDGTFTNYKSDGTIQT